MSTSMNRYFFINQQRVIAGFTLIELLVVIAIIGLLSSVILSSLNSARAKGADASVKASLKQIYNQAEFFRNDNGGYGTGTNASTDTVLCTAGMFNDPQITLIKNNITSNAASGATFACSTGSNGQKWAIAISALKGGGAWCVDNSANFKATASTASGVCQ